MRTRASRPARASAFVVALAFGFALLGHSAEATAPTTLALASTDAILALGDSLTDVGGPAGPWYVPAQGTHVPNGFGPRFVAPTGQVLRTPLGRAPLASYQGAVGTLPTWVNSGISGYSTSDVLANLSTMVYAKTFTVIVILLGVNDTLHFQNGTDPTLDQAKTASNVTAILSGLRSHYPTMPIIWIAPISVGERWQGAYPWNPWDADLDGRCATIQSLCATYGVTYVDTRTPFHSFEVANNPGNLASGFLTSDNVHLTTLGQFWLCDLVFGSFVSFTR